MGKGDKEEPSDEDLAEQARGTLGSDAEELLARRYRPRVVATLRKFEKGDSWAEEAAQGFFVCKWQRCIELYDRTRGASFATMIYRAVKNWGLQVIRDEKTRQRQLDELRKHHKEREMPRQEKTLLDREQLQAVKEAIPLLPNKQIEIMGHFIAADMDIQATAQRTGLDKKKVWVLLHRARMNLRQKLKKKGLDRARMNLRQKLNKKGPGEEGS